MTILGSCGMLVYVIWLIKYFLLLTLLSLLPSVVPSLVRRIPPPTAGLEQKRFLWYNTNCYGTIRQHVYFCNMEYILLGRGKQR